MPRNLIWENNQTITFTAITGKGSTGGPFTVTATSSEALPVSFTSNTTGICTVSGDVVSLVGTGATGTASISANQIGNNTFYPAPAVTRTFAVTDS
jgi:hypothetical protein